MTGQEDIPSLTRPSWRLDSNQVHKMRNIKYLGLPGFIVWIDIQLTTHVLQKVLGINNRGPGVKGICTKEREKKERKDKKVTK